MEGIGRIDEQLIKEILALEPEAKVRLLSLARMFQSNPEKATGNTRITRPFPPMNREEADEMMRIIDDGCENIDWEQS